MKLNYKRTFLVGFAFLSICAFWQMYDTIIPLILRDTYGLGDGPAGIIMSLDNLVALFLIPLFGALSDKVGRRIPFIIGRHTCGNRSFDPHPDTGQYLRHVEPSGFVDYIYRRLGLLTVGHGFLPLAPQSH